MSESLGELNDCISQMLTHGAASVLSAPPPPSPCRFLNLRSFVLVPISAGFCRGTVTVPSVRWAFSIGHC